jgi:BirA family biotin operon repressor/biotin-[acetyl-CoA-carboxylase] ligase
LGSILPDLVDAEARVRAKGCALGVPLHVLARTTSTNDEAKRAAKEGAPHGATWVAETQDAGRGRQGRAWISPPGENLTFSVLARVPCPNERVPQLAIAAGLAVVDIVKSRLPRARVVLKWPNDVLVGEAGVEKKIAGVLVESAFAHGKVESVVVGIGLNVHTRDFPEELAAMATSLALERANDARRDENAGALHRGDILADLLARLDHDLTHVAGRGLGIVYARIQAADALRGRRVKTDALEGIAEGIDTEGRLVVKRDNGTVERLFSGEVHLEKTAAK